MSLSRTRLRSNRYLLLQSMPLPDFAERFGEEASGQRWKGPIPTSLWGPGAPRPSDDKGALHAFVREQVLLGLSSKLFEASLKYVITDVPSIPQPPTPDPGDLPDLLKEELDEAIPELIAEGREWLKNFPIAEDAYAPRHHQLPIGSEFWDNSSFSISRGSPLQIAIPVEHLSYIYIIPYARPASQRLSLREVFPNLCERSGGTLVGPVFVMHGEAAVSRGVSLKAVPDEGELTRYVTYENRIIDEAVMAGWRYVALRSPDNNQLRPVDVSAAIKNHFDTQGVDRDALRLSDPNVEVLSRKIHKQGQTGQLALTTEVLLNSAPLPQRAPR